ncbi:MAG: Gldg family protein [Myxococcota bacterium]|nr:Gldg family protein [Myxococcota bacterium]
MEGRRRLLLGSNALIVTLITIVILGFLYALADRNRAQIDLSRTSKNTLDAQTIAKLSAIDETQKTVEVIFFSPKQGQKDSLLKRRYMTDLLKAIDRSSQFVEWRYIDFDQERLTAEQLSVKDYGRVVIQRDGARVDIRERELFRRTRDGLIFNGESQLSKAFSQLLSSKQTNVYIMTGHGEPQWEDTSPIGISVLAEMLDQERYTLKELNMIRDGQSSIPKDAAMVFVLGPQRPLATLEEEAILSYLSEGGALLLATDVNVAPMSVIDRLGVVRRSGVALDTKSMFPFWDRPIPMLVKHETTESLIEDELSIVLSHAAPIQFNSIRGIRQEPLLKLSRSGWIERGGEIVQGAAQFDPEFDERVDALLAAAVEVSPNSSLLQKTSSKARIVVLGDVDMLRNELFSEIPGNAPFVRNSLRGLLGNAQYQAGGARVELQTIAIAKPHLPMLRWLSLLPLPLLTSLIGFGVWWSRRGR